MRIQINIKAINTIIPFDHQTLLKKCIDQWIGVNTPEEKPLHYSFSRLEGARKTPSGITFNRETSFFITSSDAHLIQNIQKGIQVHPAMFGGMKAETNRIIEDPDLRSRKLFYVASPLILKDENNEPLVYHDPRADVYLKASFKNMMQAADLQDVSFDIAFDKNYASASTKKIYLNGNPSRASWCHVLIEGLPETKLLAWNHGLGEYSNLGFGAIM